MSAAGPLGRVLHSGGLPAKANALVLLRRVAFVDEHGELADGDQRLLEWATSSKLGQVKDLVDEVAARRAAALRAVRGDRAVRRLRAVPEWRFLVGFGERANPHEIGIALHGTYGWPTVRGSTWKGVARVGAADTDPRVVERVLGSSSRRGSVRFLDSIPADGPVPVQREVLTPHQQEWYTGGADSPAEHHNPVPVGFLVVTGTFHVDLIGDDTTDLDLAAGWLAAAADDRGVGARTGLGYGYLRIEELE